VQRNRVWLHVETLQVLVHGPGLLLEPKLCSRWQGSDHAYQLSGCSTMCLQVLGDAGLEVAAQAATSASLSHYEQSCSLTNSDNGEISFVCMAIRDNFKLSPAPRSTATTLNCQSAVCSWISGQRLRCTAPPAVVFLPFRKQCRVRAIMRHEVCLQSGYLPYLGWVAGWLAGWLNGLVRAR
jgi:hypothetical protein